MRVWIIQEIVIPSQVEIFLGSPVLSWRWLLDTWAFIGQLGLENYIPVTSTHWIEGLANTNQSVLVKTKHSNGEGNALLTLLGSFRECASTDPRDKVQSMLCSD